MLLASPYRARPVDVELPEPTCDCDLVAFSIVLWSTSLLRVVLAFVDRQTFGTEATLALICMVGLPWIFVRRGCARAAVPRHRR